MIISEIEKNRIKKLHEKSYNLNGFLITERPNEESLISSAKAEELKTKLPKGDVSLPMLDDQKGKSDELEIKNLLDDHKSDKGGALNTLKHSHIHFDGGHWKWEVPLHNISVTLQGDYSMLNNKDITHSSGVGLPHIVVGGGIKIPIGNKKKHS